MRGVVYVDMLVAVNFILDFFLLLGAKLLSGSLTSRWRCLLGAGIASLFSLVLLLPPLPLAAQLFIKTAGSVLPVLVAFRYTGPRQMIKAAAWFLLLNFFLAGAVFFVMYTFSAPGIEQNNLALYFNISPVILIMSVLAVYLVLQLISLLLGKPRPEQPVQLELRLDGENISAAALLDTGFSLRDVMSGCPCVLLSYPDVKAQLSPRLRRALDGYYDGGVPEVKDGPPVRMIPCRTVAGESLLPAFCCERCVLRYRGQTAELPGVPAAFTRHPLADGRCAGLVGPELLQPVL